MLMLGTSAHAQVKFKKGYYLDNSGQSVDCFIKNNDWKNNPAGFDYQLKEGSAVLKGRIE